MILPTCFVWAAVQKERDHEEGYYGILGVGLCPARLVQLITGPMLGVAIYKSLNQNVVNIGIIDELAEVSSCMDEYSQLNTELAYSDLSN